MANHKKATNNTKVFISYSRKDKTFVQALHHGISRRNIDSWADWEDIPLTADWWEEIRSGIESADAFAFVISPDSLSSEVCAKEIQVAVDNNKRIVPILHREIEPGNPLPDVIASHNWVYMRSNRELGENLEKMLVIINTDLAYVKQHTRLLERAYEWERNARNNSVLLTGDVLTNAENWLAKSANHEPAPLPIQNEFIIASRRHANKRQRQVVLWSTTGLVVSIGLAIVAFILYGAATVARGEAESAQSVAEQERDHAATAQVEAEEAQLKAEQQAFIARAQELAAIPAGLTARDFNAALLLSIEAFNFNDSLASRRSLYTTWQYSPFLEQYLHGHQAKVLSVAFAPNGRMASAADDGVILVWEPGATEPFVSLKLNDQGVRKLDWSPDNLLTSQTENKVIIWNLETGQPERVLEHDSWVNTLAWSESGQLASASEDGVIKVWSPRLSAVDYQIETRAGFVFDMAWSPDGRLAVSNTDVDQIQIWAFNESEASLAHSFQANNMFTVVWSPQNELISGGYSDVIHWDIEQGLPLRTLDGHRKWVMDAVWSADQGLVTVAADNKVIIWDFERGVPRETLRGHLGEVFAIDWDPVDGRLVTGAEDKTVIIWQPGRLAATPLYGHDSWVQSAAWSSDGQLATGGYDNKVILWDQTTSQPGLRLSGHKDVVFAVAWGPENQLASASGDGSVIVWDLVNLRQLHHLTTNGSEVNGLDWSAEGRLVSIANWHGVRLWNLETEQPVWTYLDDLAYADVKWSPDGQVIAVGTYSGDIQLLNAEDGRLMNTLTRHESAVLALAWSAEGGLASAGFDREIVIWDLDSATPAQVLIGHTNFINTLDWSANGELVSGADDNQVIIWDLEQEIPGIILSEFPEVVQAVTWSPDGTYLVAAGFDATILVWPTVAETLITKNCQRAGRNLTQFEWNLYFPGETYRKTCPDLP